MMIIRLLRSQLFRSLLFCNSLRNSYHICFVTVYYDLEKVIKDL